MSDKTPPLSSDHPSDQDDVPAIRKRLAELSAEQRELEAQLADLTRRPSLRHRSAAPGRRITRASSSAEKIALFRSLFRGREDVFPKRWINSKSGKSGYSPVCANEWKAGLCRKPAIKCGECPNSAFIPVADSIIEQHLRGSDEKDRDFTVGVYPMLPDETCWFLAADFDGGAWHRDASAFLETCQIRNVPASLERSRSGSGGHVWIFFAEPIPAATARRFGTRILAETMERRPEVGFASYDRLFPSQDTLPNGGFGNLIALPLQNRPRRAGHSLFVDEKCQPYADQWEYLSSIRRLTLQEIAACLDETQSPGFLPGVRLPVDEEEDEEPWLIPPSRKKPGLPITGPLPETIDMVLGDQMYIARNGLPPTLANRLLHLAAFQNPEFYKAQALRLSTFGIPRIIGCAELHSRHIALPRGCLDQAESLLSSLGIRVALSDKRNPGHPVQASFLGELTPQQQTAKDSLLPHDTGVLAATTAFGKTVVAASVIAARKTNTLILVHRRQLLDQWVARLQTFLNISSGEVGTIGGGTRKPGGFVDVAIIQSLVRKGEVDDLVSDYGQLIVDECHHLAAVSFEAVARRCRARYVLGLSATVTRKDGHHPIIFMQCGPVRYRADAREQASRLPFAHRVDIRHTGFAPPLEMADEQPSIQQIYAALTRSEQRNDMIFNDVLSALEAKRSPLVLTERRDHALHLAERLAPFARNVIVLHGGMGVKARRIAMRKLEDVGDREERLLIATGRYIGEGFDDARLDALFLTMPVSWRGTLAQYAGRLHRIHPGKREVVIYDYVDDAVPMLARMSGKRVKGYASLGYSVNGLQAS
ncbi:MAG: DEAD/DEAH box helicase family protein [Gammaproteobacteria bacterium]|nr:DEAD/DEAH box helicase family protein [Gammaproteobacteria bacterium]